MRIQSICGANDVPQTLTNKFAWKGNIEYAWESEPEKSRRGYVPENNLPFSIDVWNDKLFISIPRYI